MCTLWRKRWKAASAGSRFAGKGGLEGVLLGRAGMGGMAVSGEDSEPCWAENQERRLRLLPLLSSWWMSLVDLRLVIILERLRRFIELLLFTEAVLWTLSDVMAVPG